MRAVLARGLARMAESGVPCGGGRSLYWIEPLASRHFHWPLAKAGVAPLLLATLLPQRAAAAALGFLLFALIVWMQRRRQRR